MIHIIIMASGFSRRMGQDKLLTDLQGKPVIGWALEAAGKTTSDEVHVIYRNPGILQIIEAWGFHGLYNPSASQGQSAGIRLAVESLPDAEAYLFLAGDQPLISPDSLQRIMDAYRRNKPDIISAAWHGKRTLPVLFGRSMARHLLLLDGDRGGRDLIESGRFTVEYEELGLEQEQWDIDTPDDLERIEKWLDARAKTGSSDDEQTP